MNTVVQRLAHASPVLRKQFSLKVLGVFGSFATNQNHSGSDLDVVYELEENTQLSFKDYLLLEKTISSLTGVEEIDLVRIRNMNPFVWLTAKDTVVYV